jgi:polysaccharide biosynthesis/export protein
MLAWPRGGQAVVRLDAVGVMRANPAAGQFVLLMTAAAVLAGCGSSLSSGPEAAGFASIEPETKGSVASAERAADTFTAAATPGSSAYKIGPHDVLEISVFKVAELSKSVQVADSGTINLPLVGEVRAAGRTAQEIERDLTKKLAGRFLQKPQVTVFVKEYNSQRVTIDGAVVKPGVYPIRGRTTLLQFVATAGGLDPNSDSMIVVFRQTDGKRTAARFDFSEIRSGRVQDPAIQSGDVIVASTSVIKETLNAVLQGLPLATTAGKATGPR